MKIANRCFENVAQFRYFGTTVTNQNLICEKIKRRLNSGNACYHSAQNLLSSRLLSKNIKLRIYKSVNLPAVFYGCETWSVTLRDMFSILSRPALGSTRPPIKWVPGLFPGVKRQGREADHSPPTSAEVKKMWIYTSTPLYVFMA
jgi:hypothetical protein